MKWPLSIPGNSRGVTMSRSLAPRPERRSAKTLLCYVLPVQSELAPVSAPWHRRPTFPAVPHRQPQYSQRNPRVHSGAVRSSRLRAQTGK
jgi:hypothetical protein